MKLRGAWRERLLGIDGDRKVLVLDPDQLRGVLGRKCRTRHDQDDGLTHEAYSAVRECRTLGDDALLTVFAGEVEKRRCFDEPCAYSVLSGVHAHDADLLQCLG